MSKDRTTGTEITIRDKHPSERLITLINDVMDKGRELQSVINQVYEQGADEGFSKEEIRDIVRQMARAKGLNKDQVYYLTHKPEMLEKSKLQYEELKTRNIPIDIGKPSLDSDSRLPINTISESNSCLPINSISVQDWRLDDVDKYDKEFLIKIIHHLYRKLEPKTLVVDGYEVKTKPKRKAKVKKSKVKKSK